MLLINLFCSQNLRICFRQLKFFYNVRIFVICLLWFQKKTSGRIFSAAARPAATRGRWRRPPASGWWPRWPPGWCCASKDRGGLRGASAQPLRPRAALHLLVSRTQFQQENTACMLLAPLIQIQTDGRTENPHLVGHAPFAAAATRSKLILKF